MARSAVKFEASGRPNPILGLWWVAALCAIIGGAAGYLANRLQPPVYEARAVFMASIDFNKIDFSQFESAAPPHEFYEGDENTSLEAIRASLLNVEPQVVAYARQKGLSIDAALFAGQSAIERKHAFWEVSFRDADPAAAQDIVNYWAQQALADLQAKQAANQLAPYLFFDLIQRADRSKNPVHFHTNAFVLAGGAIGMAIGVLLVNLPLNRRCKE